MTFQSASLDEANTPDPDTATLFSPISLGAIDPRHRVVHAPTTRLRADPDHTPSALMVAYYGQRASSRRRDADLVAFGRFFTSNPDLPERLRRDLPLTPYQREAFWGGTERWYSDFQPYQPTAAAG